MNIPTDPDEIDKKLAEIDQRMGKIEEEGIKNLLKHFDRIHDKLFTFNNILIAGFFALSKLMNTISAWTILIPIANMIVLLWIEFRMMEKSRFEANVKKKSLEEIAVWRKTIDKTNLYSLLAVFSTSIVTFWFLYYLFCLR